MMMLEVFSNLDDPVILRFCLESGARRIGVVTAGSEGAERAEEPSGALGSEEYKSQQKLCRSCVVAEKAREG